MKKLYFFLEQIQEFGGSETVDIAVMNELVNFYDVTLVVTDKERDHIAYDISPKIKIIYLDNEDDVRIDERIVKAFKGKHYLTALRIIFKTAFFSFFGKYKYRKKVESLTNKNDILIACMPSTFKIMPKDRTLIYHYHFNSRYFFSFGERFNSLFYHKPDKMIFLSKGIYKEVTSKRPKLKVKGVYIENPIKLKEHENIHYYNNNLVYIGRFADQKNPLLLIKVCKVLKDKGFPFKLEMYGGGKLFEAAQKEIKKGNLENEISLKGENRDVGKILSDKDLLILTSVYEGMPLVINEANSQSVPVLTTNFGNSVYDAVPIDSGVIVESFDPEVIADAVIKMLSNKEKLMDYRKNALKSSRRFSKDIIIEKWRNLLKNFE